MMSSLGIDELLVANGWEDLGGGWWSHHQVEGGKERFGREAAVCHEDRRKAERIDWLTGQLDLIRQALGATCSYSDLPAMIPELVVAAAEARRRADGDGNAADGRRTVRCPVCDRVGEVPLDAVSVICACGAKTDLRPAEPEPAINAGAKEARQREATHPNGRLRVIEQNVADHERVIGALAVLALYNNNTIAEAKVTLADARGAIGTLKRWMGK